MCHVTGFKIIMKLCVCHFYLKLKKIKDTKNCEYHKIVVLIKQFKVNILLIINYC